MAEYERYIDDKKYSNTIESLKAITNIFFLRKCDTVQSYIYTINIDIMVNNLFSPVNLLESACFLADGKT